MALRVLVQAGHLAPREPKIPGLGAAGEVELNTKIRDALVKLLRGDDRFDAIPGPGNLPDAINGTYDVATRLAVKHFQRKHNITPDDLATVDERTWDALEAVSDPR